MSAAVIRIANLSFSYQSVEVLSDISVEVAAGDYVGLVGPNGSGKTTLVRALLGIAGPTQGTVSLFGQSADAFREWHRIGYLPQKSSGLTASFPATVREVVSLGLIARSRFFKRLQRDDASAVELALERLGIAPIGHRRIGELSGGQQQRVLIARAIVGDPELIIFDEPSAALDPESREHFFALLRELNRGRRVTMILVTHDIGTIGQYASKLLYIDRKVIFYGGFDEFCRSENMTALFGGNAQHIICHRHTA